MSNSKTPFLVATLLLVAVSGSASADANVTSPGRQVQRGNSSINVRAEGITTTATDGNTASVTIGGIDADADVQGVTVINGRVSIDGKDIPANVTRYKSPRSGTVYLIQRKGNSVNVTTDEGAKK